MSINLKDNVAIVTGAGRGIGRAIALALATIGVDVVVAARRQSEIDLSAGDIDKIGRKSLSIRADITQERDVDNLITQTIRHFGRIDVLVNNAGIGLFAKVSELGVKDFDAMWAVNMRGVFLCTSAVIPTMKKQNSGDIINISSLAGRNAFIGGAGYCATKWALIGFSRCLMLEVRQHNIRVITICPGSVDTGFGDQSETSLKSSGAIPKAEDVAQVVVDALKMPRNVMISEIDIRPTNPKK